MEPSPRRRRLPLELRRCFSRGLSRPLETPALRGRGSPSTQVLGRALASLAPSALKAEPPLPLNRPGGVSGAQLRGAHDSRWGPFPDLCHLRPGAARAAPGASRAAARGDAVEACVGSETSAGPGDNGAGSGQDGLLPCPPGLPALLRPLHVCRASCAPRLLVSCSGAVGHSGPHRSTHPRCVQ